MKKVLLTLIAAALLCSCKKKEEVKPEELPATTELTAYFKMDGDLTDSTGTLTGAATNVTFSPKTALFNGTSSYGLIPASGTITIPDQFSFSFFFKANYTDNRLKPRLLQMTDERGNGIDVYIDNSRVLITNWDETQRRNVAEFITPASPDMTLWHKVVATMNFSTNEMNLYVDDQQAEAVRTGALLKPGKTRIILGRHEHMGMQPMDYYNGELDNLRFYGSVVTPAQFPRIVR